MNLITRVQLRVLICQFLPDLLHFSINMLFFLISDFLYKVIISENKTYETQFWTKTVCQQQRCKKKTYHPFEEIQSATRDPKIFSKDWSWSANTPCYPANTQRCIKVVSKLCQKERYDNVDVTYKCNVIPKRCANLLKLRCIHVVLLCWHNVTL